MDTRHFPRRTRQRRGAFLGILRKETELDRAFLSPSTLFVAGERTGRFRLEEDRLLTDEAGSSCIPFEEYAIAVADEPEWPAHVWRRFIVGC